MKCCHIVCDGEIDSRVISDGELKMDFFLDGDVGVSLQTAGAGLYIGPYEVNPKFEKQILATKDKLLTSDITINEITVSRVSNPSGGKTVYIGGNINGK